MPGIARTGILRRVADWWWRQRISIGIFVFTFAGSNRISLSQRRRAHTRKFCSCAKIEIGVVLLEEFGAENTVELTVAYNVVCRYHIVERIRLLKAIDGDGW